MRISAQMKGLREALNAVEGNLAEATTGVMRWGTGELKDALRQQMVAAGFSERLAKTWQGKTFPERRNSLSPASYVWSKAPGIVDAYSRGVTIVPRAGRRFLAIPTDDVPLKRQGNSLTPMEVEARFGRRLQFVDPKDKGFHTPSIRRAGVAYLVMKGLVTRKATGRWRGASANELAGRTRNPRPVQSVVMFILVPQVRIPRRLDLQTVADKVGGAIPQKLAEAWSQS